MLSDDKVVESGIENLRKMLPKTRLIISQGVNTVVLEPLEK